MNHFSFFLLQFISSLLSLGFVALLIYVFREWIKRAIDSYYKNAESEETFKNQVKLDIMKQQMPMAIEMVELIYKARNYAKTILDKQTALVKEKELFSQSIARLTERLYLYRVLMDQDVFEIIHCVKRAGQDFFLYLDVSDRAENLRKGELYFSKEIYEKMNSLYEIIVRVSPKILFAKNRQNNKL